MYDRSLLHYSAIIKYHRWKIILKIHDLICRDFKGQDQSPGVFSVWCKLFLASEMMLSRLILEREGMLHTFDIVWKTALLNKRALNSLHSGWDLIS